MSGSVVAFGKGSPGRKCALCGKGGGCWAFTVALRALGVKGEAPLFAHRACITKEREARCSRSVAR